MPDGQGMRAVDPDQNPTTGGQQSPGTSGTETATTNTEKRFELGFFARTVTTTSTTPPDYQDPPDG